MKFSSDSKNLVIAYNLDNELFEIQVIKIDENGAFGEANFSNIHSITEIRSIDANEDLQEVYIIHGPFWSYNLSIVSFSGEVKETIQSIRAFAMSPDGSI